MPQEKVVILERSEGSMPNLDPSSEASVLLEDDGMREMKGLDTAGGRESSQI